MSTSEQQVDVRAPLGVSSADESPPGFCEVALVIPSLEKALFGNKPANGSVVTVDFGTTDCRSFTFKASVTDGKSKVTTQYELEVKKLPGLIDPAKSYHKIKKGQVKLYLKKAEEGSWVGALSAHGIDQS